MVGYRKSIQFVYHPNNELKQTITITDTGLDVQRTTTNYFYDAFGRRIAKHSNIEQLSKLNQQGKLVKYPTTLLHLSKTQKTQYQTTLMLWEGNRQIQEYTDQLIFTTVYDQDSFEPVSRVVQSRDDECKDVKIYHYHNNHLGTPQELTNELGEVIWCNYEYAWGGSYQSYYKEQSLNNIPIDKDHLQPIKFQGQSYDVETGLHYNRFRYYDSDVGMFIQRDPIGLLGGVNVFAYAPNPIHWIDVLGLNPIRFLLKIIQRPAKSKPISLPSQKTVKIDMKHILDRHTCTGCVARQSGIKDLFPANWTPKQIENAIREAYSNVKIIKTQENRVLGQGKSGNMIIEMWINKSTKTIETAYPKGYF